jgi:very-short-patch-repair endonuclease
MDLPLSRRRSLRRQSTEAETALWRELRGRRFDGFKFRRQHPCGPYIIDFFCTAASLAIEIDGGQHFEPEAQTYDARRTSFLTARGIRVLRFGSDEVLREPRAVLAVIAGALGIDASSF